MVLVSGEVIFILRSLRLTRYLSAAGLMLLLYDHFLTLDQEVEEIWKAKWTLPKIFFLILRYTVPAMMIIETYQISGISNHEITIDFCRGWFCFSMIIAVGSITVSNLLILLRLWALWGRDRKLILWTFFGFVVVQMAALAVLVHVIVKGLPMLYWEEKLQLCAFKERPHIEGLWIPGIAFECVVFTAAFVNGFHRPRSVGGQSLLAALFRDGIHYFMALFLLRVNNFFFAVLAPLPLLVCTIYLVWCCTTLTVTRFLLNIRRVASEQRNEGEGDEHEEQDSQFPMVTRETTCHSDSADSVKPTRW